MVVLPFNKIKTAIKSYSNFIIAAKKLLLQGDLTIAQVAYILGFSHQSHLNRHFKRWLGITPKVFVEHNK